MFVINQFYTLPLFGFELVTFRYCDTLTSTRYRSATRAHSNIVVILGIYLKNLELWKACLLSLVSLNVFVRKN